MTLTAWCWAGTIVYCLAMVWLGFLTRIKAEGGSFEFWIAQRQLPGWRLGTSLTSGWLMLGWIGFGMAQVYMFGATGLWILPIPWFILCFIIIAMVPQVRRIAAVSLPQGIQLRFGRNARILTAVLSFFVFMAWTQAETFMGGLLMGRFLGIQPWVAMIILIAPIIIYTWMGGFRAVVLTDVVQFTLMGIFMIVLAGVAVWAASNTSHGQILAAIQASSPPSAPSGQVFNLWVNGLLFPIVLLIGYLPGWMTEQDLLLRVQGTPSTREAYKGAITGFVLITIFVIGLPTVTAFCALVVFPPANGAPHSMIGGDATQIISAFITLLPMWVQVFMLVGIIACQMSTVDTFANVSAMPIAHDLIEPVLAKKGAAKKTYLLTARVVTAVVLLLALGCAVISDRLGDVYYISSGVLSACIAVPAFFLFWKRTTTAAVVTASAAGFVTTLAVYWYEMKHLGGDPKAFPGWLAGLAGSCGYLYVAAGVVVSVVLIVTVSLLTPRPSEELVSSVKDKPVDDIGEFTRSAAPESYRES